MGDKDKQNNNNNNTIYAMALASSLPLWHQNYTAEKTTKENGDFKKFTRHHNIFYMPQMAF